MRRADGKTVRNLLSAVAFLGLAIAFPGCATLVDTAFSIGDEKNRVYGGV
jgi:hypothetical protein